WIPTQIEMINCKLILRFLTTTYTLILPHKRTYKHHMIIDEEQTLMEILDTARQTHQEETTQHEGNFRWADGYILVYAINDRQSFLAVGELKQQLDTIKKTSIQCLLVGNKADLLHERRVATEEGEALAQELCCGFFETSARDGGQEISEIFYELHRDIRRRKMMESKGRRRSSAQQVKHVFNRMLNRIGSTS
ncbi:unnamed protein product, partial [Candidula unifasciata]